MGRARAAPYRAAAGEFALANGEHDALSLDELVGLSRAETPLATVRRLVELIPDRFEYRTGVTYVGSTVADLLEAGAGVCQDFARLALLLCAATGSPPATCPATCGRPRAATRTPSRPRWRSTRGSRRSWRPRATLWVPADPTNRTLGGEDHVKIGHGRRYADVPPVKGVFRGAGGADLSASVRMTRTDASSPTRAA